MRGTERGIAAGLSALALALLALAGCGSEEEKSPPVKVSDKKIVKALDLQKEGKELAIGGDTTCLVSSKLLNDPDDVAKARGDKKTKAFVVEAKSGGYGVVGVPIFPPECGQKAVKALAKVKLPKK